MDAFMTQKALSRIKSLLKSKGLTYADLAGALDVSEVTVKRVLNNNDISLQRLVQISNILGVSLFEELAELEMAPKKSYIFTTKQDDYFF